MQHENEDASALPTRRGAFPTPRALSTAQAARYLNLSESYLYQASSRGNPRKRPMLPQPLKVGRRLLWLIDDLDAFLNRLQRDKRRR